MKKLLALALSLILTLAFFGGCGIAAPEDSGKGDSSTDSSTNAGQVIDPNIETTLTMLIPSGNKNEKDMVSCLVDLFNEKYPNVTVKFSYVSVSDYSANIKRLALANILPDIVWSNSPDYYFLVNSNYAEPLNAYIDKAEEDGEFNFENDFYTEYFNMGAMNGNYYCVPRSCDSVITFLNTDILKKAGVDLDPATTKVKNGWSWSDFMDVCAKVRTYFDNDKDLKGNYVIDANLTGWLSVCYPLLSSYGAEIVDKDGKNVINSDATRKCLAMLREMVEKRYIVDSTAASMSSYETGGSAMLFQSASVSLFADRVALKGKVDLVSFPLINDNASPKIGAGIAGYCINKSSTQKALAWEFIKVLLSHDGQEEMALNGLNLAPIRKDLSDYKTANWGKGYENLNLAAYTYGSEYKIDADFLTRVPLSAKEDLTEAIMGLFKNICNQTKTIDKCLSTAVSDINDALQEY